jgi:hypothetical protein
MAQTSMVRRETVIQMPRIRILRVVVTFMAVALP